MSDDAARRREAELFGPILRGRRALRAVLETDRGIDEAGWQPTGEGALAPDAVRCVWTGVGSRETPAEMLAVMVDLGARFARAGWTLRSGAGAGADHAFERGAVAAGGAVGVYLPWAGFNGHASPFCEPPQAAHDLAATIHPAWPRLTDRARRLHARNTQQVQGADLTSLSTFVVCWTPDGAESEAETSRETGGTATAIAVANRRGVPVFNLARAGRVEAVDAHAGTRHAPAKLTRSLSCGAARCVEAGAVPSVRGARCRRLAPTGVSRRARPRKLDGEQPRGDRLATRTTGEKKSTDSKSNGRKHTVVGSLANLELVKAKSALRLEIFSEATKLGALEIGRGSLYWWGHGRTKSARIDWTRFAAMMDEITHEKRR